MVALKWICLATATTVVLWYALTRDIRYSREYMGDLRNRVVGARIIEDGGSPYFYKWKPRDPLRYYDPQAFDIFTPSICTSTPFLHRLLIPLADLPFATIMRVWMGVLYLLYFAMAGYAFTLARTSSARSAILVVAILFLLTNAWELHTKYGQTYLLIPALAMLVFALRRWPVLAGLAAAALVMVRPNAVLFLVPLLLMRDLKWAFWAPAVVALGWVLLSPRERGLWGDYEAMLGEQVKIHQDLSPATRPAVIDPGYRHWEGLDMDTVRGRIGRDPVHIYSENGNVFVLYRELVGRRMPVVWLGVSGVVVIGTVLWVLVLVRQRYGEAAQANRRSGKSAAAMPNPPPGELPAAQMAIAGFCLYMISDLFSPIYRHAYYGVQWIMPLLIAASLYRRRDRGVYGLLLVCLLLNIVHLPFLRMGNTIGEYGFLGCLMAIALGSGGADGRKSGQAGLR